MSKLSETDMKAPFNFQCSSFQWTKIDPATPAAAAQRAVRQKSSRYITALYYTLPAAALTSHRLRETPDARSGLRQCDSPHPEDVTPARAAYTAKTQELKDFTRTHHIPKHLKRRMQEVLPGNVVHQ
uniref:Uncharacterized protein n=1 Tax=Macrostomum lignano TaxID=282301 RepID=A0A1I8F5R5_9PLAT